MSLKNKSSPELPGRYESFYLFDLIPLSVCCLFVSHLSTLFIPLKLPLPGIIKNCVFVDLISEYSLLCHAMLYFL